MEIRYRTIVKLVLILLLVSIFAAISYSYATASNLKDAFQVGNNDPLKAAADTGGGFDTGATYEGIISKIITMAVSLIGVIFLILAIYGGYMWMTASGNEEMVAKAQKVIIGAVIGLIVIMAAYAISRYIVSEIGSKVFKDTSPVQQPAAQQPNAPW